MTTVPLAAAAIVAIFACGIGYIAWRAWPLRAEEPRPIEEIKREINGEIYELSGLERQFEWLEQWFPPDSWIARLMRWGARWCAAGRAALREERDELDEPPTETIETRRRMNDA